MINLLKIVKMASTGGKKTYNGDDCLDDILLNQVAKRVFIQKLSSFAKDLKISQVEYDKITAPNMYTQDERIHRVSTM